MSREVLGDLGQIGFHFRALEIFVECSRGVGNICGAGLYRHALASGLTGESGALMHEHATQLGYTLGWAGFALIQTMLEVYCGSRRHNHSISP